jgi:hypothetical protein
MLPVELPWYNNHNKFVYEILFYINKKYAAFFDSYLL